MDAKQQATTEPDTNSKNTRVQPVFRWLKANGGPSWPTQLITLAHGLTGRPNNFGSIVNVTLDPECCVPATHDRLAWMLENAEKLVPKDGRRWRTFCDRLSNRDEIEKALSTLRRGTLPKGKFILEGPTHCELD
jgi:hypothetical protein